MSEFLQYGVSVRTLSDYIDRLCLKQGNMREANYTRYLVMGEDIWKDLYRNTIWNIKRAVLQVDCDNKIQLPQNCERLINISVVDRFNQLHPLTSNSNYNTSDILCQAGPCSCHNCNGEHTLCAALDSLNVTTETVMIQGSPYTLTTWTRYDKNGALQKEQSIPTYLAASNEVIYQTVFTLLCNLDITDKGCIKPTQPNLDLLRTYCGWDNLGWNGVAWRNKAFRPIIPVTVNYWGEYNYNAEDPTIIHLFRYPDRIIDNNNNRIDNDGFGTVILTYKTNGDIPGQEILIPEYATGAMDAGIIWQQRALNPRDGDRSGDAERKYRAEKTKIFRYLNPVTMETMQKLQQAPHRW